MDPEIDIIGVGRACGFLAASLCRGGLRPRIISRGAALRQLQEVGLTIISEDKRLIHTPMNCSALDDVRQFAPIVLLTTKSYDLPALLDEIAPRVAADTLLVTGQNGFAAYDSVSSMYAPERSIMGVPYVSAPILSPTGIDVNQRHPHFFSPALHPPTPSPPSHTR